MTRVLYVAYHFPPIGGAGVQRNARFVRRLPRVGYRPAVVTGPGALDGRWTPADDTLVGKLPADVEVHRIAGPEPPPSEGMRDRAERLLGLEPPSVRWWIEGAVQAGRTLARDCDVIYVSAVPYESAEIGARLSRELGKPWVADLQDPWALDEMWIYPTRWHRRADLGRMRRLLGTAGAIVMNTPEAAARLVAAFPELARRLVVSITNGYDEQDFAVPVPARTDDAFRVVHTGTLHTDLGRRHRSTSLAKKILGGTAMEVDILTRSHLYLMEAVERLAAVEPRLVSRLELHFAGVLSEGDREDAARSAHTRLHGYLTHEETLALARTADLLFLPMQNLPPGTRAGLTPGKTYEYLASGRPILAAVPDGDTRDLLAEAGAAFCVRPDDIDGMVDVLRTQLRRRRAGEPPPQRDQRVVARYEAGRLTDELAALFEQLAPARRTVEPRAAPVREAQPTMSPLLP